MSSRSSWWRSAACAVLLGVAGCQTPDPLAPAAAGRIQSGMKPAEVRQVLGTPTLYEQAPDGRAVEVYEATRSIFGSHGVREREEALEVRWFSVRYSGGGQVEKTLLHRGVFEGFTMLYTRSFGPEIDPARVLQVRSGTTTRAELEQWFGPPSLARLEPAGGLRLEWIYQRFEAGVVQTGQTLRALEVVLDDGNVVRSLRTIDRAFPSWRR